MNFGQVIKFVDSTNKWHQGTVVAKTNDPNQWGVSRNMRPPQGTQPDLFVKLDGAVWRDFTSKGVGNVAPAYNIGLSQQLYTNSRMLRGEKGFVPEAIPVAKKSMGLGELAYRKSFQQQGQLK